MNVTTIGIQAVMPSTGTPKQQQQQQDDRPARPDAPDATVRAAPPQGMGKYVDKTA